MDNQGSAPSSLPAQPPRSVNEYPAGGDEELDEETVKHISALYAALGPLLPQLTQLPSHQDPPAHLMVDIKAKLRELGSSISDAKNRMLRYNIYLKKKLARAVQERKALMAQQMQQQDFGPEQPSATPLPKGGRPEVQPGKLSAGTEEHIQEIITPEIPRLKPPERAQRRVRLQDTHLAAEDAAPATVTPQGCLQKNACKVDNMASCPSLERTHL